MPVPSILARITVWLFLLVLLGLLAAAGGILIALPPAVLFSAWIARRMTGRLERLTRSTDALRAGDLAVRVPVEGEDEVATLQANFNAMAADLEKSTQALQAERDKVAALLKSQRELTASVSHELRTPISTMAGYLEYLDQHLDERPLAGTRCDLAVVRREADRLNAILNDLFDLSQAEVERLSLNLAPLAVEQVAQRALVSVEKLAWETRRIQATLAVEPGLPCVQADGLRLEQVLLNLLHNALRHTPPGGVVELSARREGAAVRLEVADSGEGIAPEDLPRVWEKFYRAASNAPGGAGLGLALVKELVEAMGGSVGVTSVPGSGSCFWVQLPALAEENK
jgi:signal transduction histidine kinase